jgi:hypothetical protein
METKGDCTGVLERSLNSSFVSTKHRHCFDSLFYYPTFRTFCEKPLKNGEQWGFKKTKKIVETWESEIAPLRLFLWKREEWDKSFLLVLFSRKCEVRIRKLTLVFLLGD